MLRKRNPQQVGKAGLGCEYKTLTRLAATPVTSTPTPQPLIAGRPRLVAKNTSSQALKVKPFKASAPDPMLVWNKNRITPQPSTKNLTDEELKQQYGIHLTSRLQADEGGTEAKWADIDDDEDDWAPETIEWGDGTKTTVNPADITPIPKSEVTSKPSTPAIEVPKPILEAKQALATPTSIGPNAKVLKLGARAEVEQAQKAAHQSKGPTERIPLVSNKSTPAPVPAKSPWAKLPPVERVSPVEVHPQPVMPPNGVWPVNNTILPPAREISADDFNRRWGDATQPQLFMPNSGRYEPIPENQNRRRMSRNDGFRAPAVLQRPGQSDPSQPEPSPAFQTNRTSSDVVRRRASSTLSGEAAQIVRRMSVKSGEAPMFANGSAIEEGPETPAVSRPSQPATPAYQARGGDYLTGPGQTEVDIEAQKAEQRKHMREQAEIARKRRQEEEARLEAEKRERIRRKLASLGPDPKTVKAEEEARAKAEADAKAQEEAQKAAEAPKSEASINDSATTPPPKPPQPTATGEPQQYGMMKVHAMDSVKKNGTTKPLSNVHNLQPSAEEISPEPPTAALNGHDINKTDASPIPEPIPRNRPVQEARTGWGRNDHRSSPAAGLWGAPHNKALGNGTFDHGLAAYAPQDLSSRASSTGQGWMNGRTPTVGQSPQLANAIQHVPETRSQTLQNMTSPEPTPLAVNSEADSMLPVRPPAPIGPPQHSAQHSPMLNGYSPAANHRAVAGWNNFGNVARAQERADYDQFQREATAKREEEDRTGVRPQANYNFDQTFKQVELGEQADQRHVAAVSRDTPSKFGAVGSRAPQAVGSQVSRGSRFFPQQTNGIPQAPRTVTHTYIEIPRSPSPPPAEHLLSDHPAWERTTPLVRFPPEKAVVKLPPAKPQTPPAPATTATPAQVSAMSAQPQQPMTWAARAAMPPPKPAAPLRTVSQPIVKNPSWQERFNGLLGNERRQPHQPTLAVTSATKEPLGDLHVSAFVSLPGYSPVSTTSDDSYTSKEVEEEEDLFEDREAGSLPILYFPGDAPAIVWPRAIPARVQPTPPDTQSGYIFLGAPWKEDKHYIKPQYAIIKTPGSDKSIKKDIPIRSTPTPSHRGVPRHVSARRGQPRGGRGRPAPTKA